MTWIDIYFSERKICATFFSRSEDALRSDIEESKRYTIFVKRTWYVRNSKSVFDLLSFSS
jgi:hypothetical protein